MASQAHTSLRQKITNLVQALLEEQGLASEVPPAARLADLGLASFAMVNLMLALEAEFDLTIPSPDITPENFMSVEAIERLMARMLPQDVAA